MGALNSMLNNRGLGIKTKKCLYKGVIVSTLLNGAEAWSMRSAERRKVNVAEMKYLRSLVGVSQNPFLVHLSSLTLPLSKISNCYPKNDSQITLPISSLPLFLQL